MNEFSVYLLISFISLVLFYIWYNKQKNVEKKWLIKKISEANDGNSAVYSKALSQLQTQKNQQSILVLIAFMIIPVTFAIDYLWFHEVPIEERYSMADVDSNEGSDNAPDLATAINQLEQKLAANPNDLEGQLLYGRSMMQLQKYVEAVGAYQRANEIQPGNADILVELAEAMAFKNNTGSFLGEPEALLNQALSLNPNNQKGMWLKGIVLYESEDFVAAEQIWTDLLNQVSNPNIQATIRQQINQARTAQNKSLLAAPLEADGNSFFVIIDADTNVKSEPLKPNSRVFIYAKQVDSDGRVSMPMPIAAVPISQPFNWPISVTISDRHNLNPGRKLSSFERIQFSAKLSLNGNATPSSDDIISKPEIVTKSTQNIQLTLIK